MTPGVGEGDLTKRIFLHLQKEAAGGQHLFLTFSPLQSPSTPIHPTLNTEVLIKTKNKISEETKASV